MDTLFFIASKTLGMAARAETWLLLGLILTLFGIWRNRRRLALGAGLATFAAMLALTLWPLGDILLEPLEAKYPNNPPLTQVDAIIVLGGAEKTGPMFRWGSWQLSDAGERMIAGMVLANRFPAAKLIFTGGTSGLLGQSDTSGPSFLSKSLWLDMGIKPDRIVLEPNSRNTTENARFTYDLLQPRPDQHFVLVTSAFHMPRSMQSFANAGWQNVTAYPVDFRSGDLSAKPGWRFDENLNGVDTALKEYLGLFVYWATGR